MISWIGGLAAVIVFFVLLKQLKVIAVSQQVIRQSGQAMAILNDKALTDLQKEKSMQAFSIQFFKAFLQIFAGSAAAFCVPAAVLWVLDRFGLLKLDELVTTTLSWEFIGASLVLGVLLFVMNRKTGTAG